MPQDMSAAKAARRRQTQAQPPSVEAQAASGEAAARLTTATQTCMAGVVGYIERTTAQRSDAIDQAADKIAQLHDPVLFQAEVLHRAAQRIGAPSGESPLGEPQLMNSGYQSVSLPVLPALPWQQPAAGSLPEAG